MTIPGKILKSFANRNVLVTGGTGMIGRQIVDLVCAAGASVRVASLDKITVHDRAEHIYGDLTEFGFCKEIARDMDFVFHIAGIKGSVEVTKTKPASFFVPLLMMNTNVLEACRLSGVQKLVYTSSIGAYSATDEFRECDYVESEPPMDMFPGWAKRMAEKQIEAYRIQYGLEGYSIVRPANVYGPGDNFDPDNAMVIPSLMYRIATGDNPLVVWGDGSVVRDFVYSADVARGAVLALHSGTAPGFVNLGSGTGFSIKELVETLNSFIPFDYEFDASKPAGHPRRVMDLSLAREKTGYAPTTSLGDGLRATWEWFLAHRDEHLKKTNYLR